MARQYVVNGESLTMRKAELKYGIEPTQVRRLSAKYGISLQEVYSRPDIWSENVELQWEDPPYSVLGITYDSLDTVAKACCMEVDDLRKKIARQYAGRVSWGVTMMQDTEYLLFSYKGVTYANAPGILGYPYGRVIDMCPDGSFEFVIRRVRIGKSLDDAITEWETYDPTYVVGDVRYKNKTAMLRELGITSASFDEMAEKLGSEVAAVEYYKQKREAEKYRTVYTVNGTECVSLREVYDALGLSVNYTTFCGVARARGVQGAIDYYMEVGSGGKLATIERFTVGDATNLGIKEAAELAHTAAPTLRKRSQETGKTIQELLDESYQNWIKDPPPYSVDGVMYNTPTEAARALGVLPATVLRKRAEGMLMADIIEYVKTRKVDAANSAKDNARARELKITTGLYRTMRSELGSDKAVEDYLAKFPMLTEPGNQHQRGAWRECAFWDCIIDNERYYMPTEIAHKLCTTKTALQCYRHEHPMLSGQEIVNRYIAEVGTLRNVWRPVEIDGKVFNTCAECAEYLGVGLSTLRAYIRIYGQQEAIDGVLNHTLRSGLRGLTRASADIGAMATIVEGYIVVYCQTCRRSYILPRGSVYQFTHDSHAGVPEVPYGWRTPIGFKSRIEYINHKQEATNHGEQHSQSYRRGL